MKTKVIVIKTGVSVEDTPKYEPIPIEFHKLLSVNGNFVETRDAPISYNFVELICLNYSDKLDPYCRDLMFAFDDPKNREAGTLFLGRWNDGIVEGNGET